jgi:chemotaxis signal transduction protein
VKEIINLRREIIPDMDVRLRFGKEAREYNDRICTIVIEAKDTTSKVHKGVGKAGDNIKLILY